MSIGFTELLLIAAVAALLFGGRRIAQLGTELGKTAGHLKRGAQRRAEESEDGEDGEAKPKAEKPVLVELVEAAREVKNATDKVRKFPLG
jgi:TatA/E family protein of Tat protein translocase